MVILPNLKYKLSWGIKFLAEIIERSCEAIIFISKHFYLKETWSNQFYQHHQNDDHVSEKEHLLT